MGVEEEEGVEKGERTYQLSTQQPHNQPLPKTKQQAVRL